MISQIIKALSILSPFFPFGKTLSYVLAKSAVPSGIAPSGTVGNNGALTLGTALDNTYSGGLFLYFPAGAIVAGSAAGSYWTVMTSGTAGTIYNNTLSGIPTRPSTAVPFATVGPGAYTGETGEVTLSSGVLPANSLGANGNVVFVYGASWPSSANNKTLRHYISTTKSRQVSGTATLGYIDYITFSNRGLVNNNMSIPQIFGGGSPFGTVGGAMSFSAIDTTAAQPCSCTGQTASPLDFIILQFETANINKG